jgi:hypothetical protein
VNRRNYHCWAAKNPQELHQHPLHSDKLTVWCGIASFGVLGPYFFEDNEGAVVAVATEHYVEMLHNFCEPELRRHGSCISSVWFQQDGATAHTARTSISVLRECFHNTSFLVAVTFHGLRSPDLSACDYFLWGYLKSKLLISKPTTTEELKQGIKEEVSAIPEQMTHQVMENH